MGNEYRDVHSPATNEVREAIERNESQELLEVVVGVALYHEDPAFAVETCLLLARHEHFNVRGNAVLGFGHLARRFGLLDEALVRPIIESALNDSSDYVRGQAWAAAADVSHFLGWDVSGFSQSRVVNAEGTAKDA